MKKNLIIILSAFLTTLTLSCANHSSDPATDGTKTQDQTAKETGMNDAGAAEAAVYTCPMHPEVTSDKEDNCPKCGMKVELKK